MFKFLRKYNKWILAVGGSLLMITFIAPQMVQQFGGTSPGRVVVATYDGGKITAQDIQKAQAEVQIVSMLAPAIVQSLGVQGPDHWFLLGQLAERNGLLGSAEDGRDFLNMMANAYAQQQAFGMDPAQVHEMLMAEFETVRIGLIQERGYTSHQIDLALARLRSIDRLIASVSGEPLGGGIALSGPEFRAVGRHLFDQAQVDIVTFNANSPMVSDLPEPDEAKLQEVFERFQSDRPETNEFGLGYYRQPVAAVEWLTINRGLISSRLQLDPIEVRKYHQRNRNLFPGEFAAEQLRVEQAYRNEQVDRIMEAAVRAVRSELLRATRALPSDGRFRVIPSGWNQTRPSMQALVEAAMAVITTEPGLAGSRPVENGRTAEMVDPDRLASLDGISGSYYPVGNRQLPFRDLVLSVRELMPDTPLPLQRGITFGPIYDGVGNRSFFTVVEVRAEGPAPILDVVRDQVASDAKRLTAYEKLSSESELAVIRSVLAEKGIEGAAAIGSRRFDGVQVSRASLFWASGSAQLRDVDQQVFRDAVLHHILDWDATVPAGELPLAERVLVVPVPNTLTVAAVQINQHYPATRDRVRQNEGLVSTAARSELNQDINRPMLSLESLTELMNFKTAAPPVNEDEESEE